MTILYDFIIANTRANQPAAAAANKGYIYIVTDESNALEYSTGSAWIAVGGGGGGATWTLIDSQAASGMSAVNFTDLGSYHEILVYTALLAPGTSGTAVVQVSEDNGLSYETASGYYKGVAPTGVETSRSNVPLHTTSTTSARTGVLQILNWNTTQDKLFHNLVTAAANEKFRIARNGVACDALRVVGSNGGNFSGGTAYVFGKAA